LVLIFRSLCTGHNVSELIFLYEIKNYISEIHFSFTFIFKPNDSHSRNYFIRIGEKSHNEKGCALYSILRNFLLKTKSSSSFSIQKKKKKFIVSKLKKCSCHILFISSLHNYSWVAISLSINSSHIIVVTIFL